MAQEKQRLPFESAKTALMRHLNTPRASRAARSVTRKSQKDLQELYRLAYRESTNSNNNVWLKKKLLEVLEVDIDKYMDVIAGGRHRKRQKKGVAASAAPSVSASVAEGSGTSGAKEGAKVEEGPAGSSADPSGSAASAAGIRLGPNAAPGPAGFDLRQQQQIRQLAHQQQQAQQQAQQQQQQQDWQQEKKIAFCTQLLSVKRTFEGEPAGWGPGSGSKKGGEGSDQVEGERAHVLRRQRSRRLAPSSADGGVQVAGSSPSGRRSTRQLAATMQPNPFAAAAHPFAPPQPPPPPNPFAGWGPLPAFAAGSATAGAEACPAKQISAQQHIEMLAAAAWAGIPGRANAPVADSAPSGRSSATAATHPRAGETAQRMLAQLHLPHSPCSSRNAAQPLVPPSSNSEPALDPHGLAAQVQEGPLPHPNPHRYSSHVQGGFAAAAHAAAAAQPVHGSCGEDFRQLVHVSILRGAPWRPPPTAVVPKQSQPPQEGAAAAITWDAGDQPWLLSGRPARAGEAMGTQQGRLFDCLAIVAEILFNSGDWALRGPPAAAELSAAATPSGAGRHAEEGGGARSTVHHAPLQPAAQRQQPQQPSWQPAGVAHAAEEAMLRHSPWPAYPPPPPQQQPQQQFLQNQYSRHQDQEHPHRTHHPHQQQPWLSGSAGIDFPLPSLPPGVQQAQQEGHLSSSVFYAGWAASDESSQPLPFHPSHSLLGSAGPQLLQESERGTSLLSSLLQSGLLHSTLSLLQQSQAWPQQQHQQAPW